MDERLETRKGGGAKLAVRLMILVGGFFAGRALYRVTEAMGYGF